MHLNWPTIAVIVLTILGGIVATPVLIRGFLRRGKGVRYERSFVIQRAPQLLSLLNIFVIIVSFGVLNGIVSESTPFLSLGSVFPIGLVNVVSWLGVALFISGLIFMIGGWYSLGEAFSTDAEILSGQKVRKTGLLSLVMHPSYSGIIQSLLGASIAAVSPISVLVTLFLVAPLWLNRAKYEEQLLMESLGPNYKEYAEAMHWRRLVPKCFPIGI